MDIDIRDHAKAAIYNSVYKDKITLVQGSSTDIDTSNHIKQIASNFNRVMVVLDSNHDHDHVYQELEIYADDVKCSHGSASGSLNEDSIFYLMSRGLNYQQS